MGEVNIDRNIVIDNLEEMLKILEKECGFNDIDINDIVEFVQGEKSTKFYFDDAMNGKDEKSRDIRYLWLDTGFEDSRGNPIFISLLNHSGYYSGHFIGSSYYLSKRIYQYYPENERTVIDNEKAFKEKYKRKIEGRAVKNLIEKYKNKVAINANPTKAKVNDRLGKFFASDDALGADYDDAKTTTSNDERAFRSYWTSEPSDLVKDIAGMLMINNWKSINGLDRYIKIVGARIAQLIEQKKSDYFLLNNIKSAVVNTGLLDKFGSDIYMIYRKHISYGIYVPHKFVDSKREYIYDGFIKDKSENVSLLPITFFNDGEIPFRATIDDFDITPRALYHIIEERKHRFPENVREMSDAALATKINNALDLGLKMQLRDSSFAKPSYSTLTGTISWMIPLHINREFTEEPELVLVLRKAGEFYEIKTILPYDDETKDKMTDLSLYGRLW